MQHQIGLVRLSESNRRVCVLKTMGRTDTHSAIPPDKLSCPVSVENGSLDPERSFIASTQPSFIEENKGWRMVPIYIISSSAFNSG